MNESPLIESGFWTKSLSLLPLTLGLLNVVFLSSPAARPPFRMEIEQSRVMSLFSLFHGVAEWVLKPRTAGRRVSRWPRRRDAGVELHNKNLDQAVSQ